MPIKADEGVYGILCQVNRKFYIGSSCSVNRRVAEHLAQLRRNKHDLPRLQKDWTKYGEKSFSVVRFYCPKDRCGQYENYLIETMKTLEHQHGYNKMLWGKWAIEASIRNIESKLIRSGKFRLLPHVNPEEPILPVFLKSFKR